MTAETVTVVGEERGETERARTFAIGHRIVHLPKSQNVVIERIGSWQTHPNLTRITVTRWIAGKTGLA